MKKIIYKNDNDIRIDLFVSNNTSYSRSQVSKLISKGMIKKNGLAVSKSSEKISNEDEIYIEEVKIESKIKPEKLNLDIRYEDDELIILSKN